MHTLWNLSCKGLYINVPVGGACVGMVMLITAGSPTPNALWAATLKLYSIPAVRLLTTKLVSVDGRNVFWSFLVVTVYPDTLVWLVNGSPGTGRGGSQESVMEVEFVCPVKEWGCLGTLALAMEWEKWWKVELECVYKNNNF